MFQKLNAFLDQHLPFCAGTFGPGEGNTAATLDCASLLDPTGFRASVTPLLDRYRNVDKRAVLSVWSMYYFSHLTIGPMVLWLVHRHAVPLAPADLKLRLHPETGLPEKILVRSPAQPESFMSIHDAFKTLIFDHAAPLVGQFEKHGLSSRLMWSNLAVYVEWIARELGNRIDKDLSVEGLSLLEGKSWPDGRPNPLNGLIGRSATGGDTVARRRVCCLRYILPDMAGCGMVCPLPAGRS